MPYSRHRSSICIGTTTPAIVSSMSFVNISNSSLVCQASDESVRSNTPETMHHPQTLTNPCMAVICRDLGS